jgi:mannose-6-phosphate isomerase-like protein (cupin superfamily)
MGMLFERLVGAEETAGLLGASVVTQPPGQASPLHVHTREAEAWFLLQGAMTYRAGERLIRMTAGDFIYLPREVPHAFRTTGTVPVRFLALTLPGGLLDIYDEVGVPAAASPLPAVRGGCRTRGTPSRASAGLRTPTRERRTRRPRRPAGRQRRTPPGPPPRTAPSPSSR